MMFDEDRLRADIARLPARTRWRYTLRPAFLRYVLNKAFPGRWTALEISQIRQRAAEDAAELRDLAE